MGIRYNFSIITIFANAIDLICFSLDRYILWCTLLVLDPIKYIYDLVQLINNQEITTNPQGLGKPLPQ